MSEQNENWISYRRVRNFVLMMMAIGAVSLLIAAQRNSLHNAAFTTGYLLIGALFFLAAFNWKKKLPFLAFLGRSATWMQLHIYVGLASVAIFGLHAGFKIPSGMFEQILAGLFLIVAGSGIYGLCITRIIPKKLSAVNDEVFFERIPTMRLQLANQANGLIIELAAINPMLREFYVKHLAPFLLRGRSLAYLIHPTGALRRNLASQLKDLDRYLSVDQRRVSSQLNHILKRKDDIDYHYAMQGRLKAWLFLHVGFSYSLLIVAVIHGIIVHAFAGN
jgi:hypothetical protein